MIKNKKILNTVPFKYGDINFKSELEVRVYKTLIENGIEPKYEKVKYTLWKGFYPKVPFFNEIKKGVNKHILALDKTKVMNITYTPDFTFTYDGIFVIIEAKGYENDVFPLKKKMFRKVLERKRGPVLFFEVYSKKQTEQAIQIIKNYVEQNKK